ncbi:hypothetical protein [Nocardioides nanhaiensis]|uniref:Uncharacterized protein n=1 Tax=Nocardioides nanhaiensis TaxID=1476871 RepID=A0ABP8WJD9_9ACTN
MIRAVSRPLAASMLTLLALTSFTACSQGDDGAEPQEPVTVTETVTPTPSPTPSPSETATPTEAATPTDAATSEAPEPTPTGAGVDLSQPPTSATEAEAHLAAATGGTQEARRFESSNGFYYCVLQNRFIPTSCEVLEGVRDPATCTDSPSQVVGRVEFSDAGFQPVCNTDTIREPGAPKVEAGTVVTSAALGMRCVIEPIGLTCLQDAGQGFFLGPGTYAVF